ncbi:MAG: DUF1820 family protein [Nevskiaceae bacterium]|jgi:hypothetical protein|nr:MAG: DUF1820 family protein [Nevskiaceae bacterium]TAM26740.1 MAG: DUF1820 family protein [Nevskiaceae bacterium]
MSQAKNLYRVTFRHQDQIWEIYARAISHGGLLGFIEVEKLVFGERSSIIADPGEEKLKSEFENVERTYIPVHAIVRIDEVSKMNTPRISAGGESGKVMPFPMFTPAGKN